MIQQSVFIYNSHIQKLKIIKAAPHKARLEALYGVALNIITPYYKKRSNLIFLHIVLQSLVL